MLPLAQVKTLLFGNTLISVPFCVYGGPLAADPETAAALSAHAVEAVEENRCQRGRIPPSRARSASDWLERPDLYVTFRKAIDGDHDKNMKSIPRKQRAMVRKGIQNGLRSIVNHDAGLLHGIYAESVRNLGTPVFSRRYFTMLAECSATTATS